MDQPKAQEYILVPHHPPLPLFFKHLLKMGGVTASESSGAMGWEQGFPVLGTWKTSLVPASSSRQFWGAAGLGYLGELGQGRACKALSETLRKDGLVCNMLWLEQSPAVGRIPARCR